MARDLRSDYRLLTSPLRVLPSFIIPGEAKCGTTSLYRYLVQHPDIFPADRKEPKNFITHPGSLTNCRYHYPLVLSKAFHQLLTRRTLITGEASAEYFSHPDACREIKRLLPETKIIVLMRDPVARAWSDYQMMRKSGVETRSFKAIVDISLRVLSDETLRPVAEDALAREHSLLRYVGRGIYYRSLEKWMRYFSVEKLTVLRSEDFFAHKDRVLQQIFSFLGVSVAQINDLGIKRQGNYATSMPEDLLIRLREFYEPCNSRLAELLGWKESW